MKTLWRLVGLLWVVMLAMMLYLASLPIERLPSDSTEGERMEYRLRELNGPH